MPAVRTRLLLGSDNLDRWSEKRIWDAVISDVRVLVSTPAVLCDALSHGFVKMRRLALLIFDEGRPIPHAGREIAESGVVAHNCIGDSPANRIMRDFYHPRKARLGPEEVPYILGLTASPIIGSRIADLR